MHMAPVGMVVSRVDGTFEYVNPAMLDLLGYTEQEVYSPQLIISHEDEKDVNRQIRQQLLNDPKQTVVVEKRYKHKSGRAILALTSMAALTNEQGEVDRFVAQIIDIEHRKKIEKSADLFRSMINASRDAMLIIDPRTGKILDVNIHGCESLGYSYEEMLDLYLTDIEDSLFPDKAALDRHVEIMRERKHMLVYGERVRKDGSSFPVEISTSYHVQDDAEFMLSIVRDITERKKSEALIWEQANYDSLTKLPNRNMLHDRLDRAIQKAKRRKTKVAVFCLDLDKFKEVNDTLGHHVGDQLLKEAGRRLNSCLRQTDTVARLGGDEFCVLLDQVKNSSDVDRVAQAILEALAEPFVLGVNKAYISTSIGITFYPDDADSAHGLLRNSDQAMYFAKSRGRNCFQYFTSSMQEEALERMRLSRDLFQAVTKNQFCVEYQPIVSLNNNEIYKAEALLRWHHPERGLVSSGEFITIAEENGMINRIGDWVFAEVLKTVKHWRRDFCPNFQISINASPLQFREGLGQVESWQHDLYRCELSGDAILIEITEGLIMDTDQQVTDKLLMLRDAGIQVALDDFGTGYSSLAYLQKLDIDYLKIDRSFVENLQSGSNEEALCQAIIVMAHRLDLKVVAEGIETEEQYHLLRAAGCDYGQGFYFSCSVPAEQFEKFFSTS